VASRERRPLESPVQRPKYDEAKYGRNDRNADFRRAPIADRFPDLGLDL
jgi:hypothetical protein